MVKPFKKALSAPLLTVAAFVLAANQFARASGCVGGNRRQGPPRRGGQCRRAL